MFQVNKKKKKNSWLIFSILPTPLSNGDIFILFNIIMDLLQVVNESLP